MADLGPPVRISPLIKFGRWSLLVTGIMYGAFHQRRFEKKEVIVREEKAKKKAIRDAQLVEEKKKIRAEEERAIAELSKPTVKA